MSNYITGRTHQIRDGVSLSAQQKIRPLIPSSEIMKLNNLEAFLKFPRNLPATKLTFDLYKSQRNVSSFEPREPIRLELQPEPIE